MNAAAYIRVSTDDQIEFSPASQLNQIHIYAENHQLLLLDSHIYMDEGISGRTAARRPAFLKMIAAARETPRPFDVILEIFPLCPQPSGQYFLQIPASP